jgi:hypothetical protein
LIVVAMGKSLTSTRHSRPPWNSRRGGCDIREYRCDNAGGRYPCNGVAAVSGGRGPSAKYTSFAGKSSNVASGTPKFFARRARGVWPIQSLMLNVPNSEKYPLSKIRMK